ncbi:glycosyltransferase family 9 protein [Herbaspirillum sp. RV1423]|uniref:glycosyltransferase family 9 protein n=1 Tax=Herbaspirillum sp. RV1423 TaxID=1443993 RepID=UPI0004B2D8AE|nr:glycosyltransferase family 9 protein [Herbaspirillum sp. RV1423]
MTDQLISQDTLRKADKILFVAHLALGDFTYMESCFRAFQQTYPHIQIDLWVDELRRTWDFRQWAALRKYSLFDWLDVSPCFHKVYKETYSPFVFARSLREAKQQNYPIVVSFGLSRRTFYARLVRKLNPDAVTAAIAKRYKSYDIVKRHVFENIDVRLVDHPEGATHVSDIYASWFQRLFGLRIGAEERFPQMDIPDRWRTDALHHLQQWGIVDKARRRNRVIFVNAFSKQDERSWPVEKALSLVEAMRQMNQWRDNDFIVNTVPEKWDETEAIMARQKILSNVFLFSARDNFFQLPAVLEQCDLIISVETAVMHLANAVHVPVVALMRQLTPEWVPIDRQNSRVVMTEQRDHWVQQIDLEQVIAALPDPAQMTW